MVNEEAKRGLVPKTVKYYDGVTKLNKTATKNAWKEFGGDKLAIITKDGSAVITRIVERESKKSNMCFKLVERLTKYVDGYGDISWRIDFGAVARKQKFDESWHDVILASVRAVVADGEGVSSASRKLAEKLGASYNAIRTTLWVVNKWSRGEATAFLPHISMVESIFNLLCELGKKEQVLASMVAYSKAVPKPNKHIVAILKENECI